MHEKLMRAAAYRKIDAVEIPEIGETFYVRTGSAAWYERYQQKIIENRMPDGKTYGTSGIRAAVLAGTVCDADGNLLMKDESEAAEFVRATAKVVVERLYDAVLVVNGFGDDSKNS